MTGNVQARLPVPAMSGTTDRRLAAFDGWRAISVGLVIIFHASLSISFPIGTSLESALRTWLSALGILGVHIFFVISGYVITRGLMSEEGESGQVSLRGFYVRRIFRILPPLLLYVATILLLTWVKIIPEYGYGAARALTFTCNFPDADCGRWTAAHTWSLSVEEQFYLVAPLFFVLTRRWRAGASVLAYVALVLVREWAPHFSYVAAGVMFASNERVLVRVVRKIPVWGALLLVAAMLVCARAAFTSYAPISHALQGPLIATILMATTFGDNVLRQSLSRVSIVALGKASYGIYLWQQLATARRLATTPLLMVVFLVVAIAIAIISFNTWEKWLIRLSHNISGSFRARCSSVGPTDQERQTRCD